VDQLQLDAVVAALTTHAMPVVDANSATFAIRADADAVYLRHRSNQWPRQVPLAKIPGADLWFVTMPIEPGARVQYQFELVRGQDGRRLNDPNNPLLSRSPVGDSSVCFGPGYVQPDWAGARTDTAPGQLVELRLHSQAQDRDNRVNIDLPAGFDLTARYPLLVVHDGGDYLGYAAMKAVLDNLIAAGDVAPLVAAFIYPGQRLIEYADDPRHATWVARELVPELETRYPLGRSSGRCLMGASFGAIASLATAVRYPQAFSALLLQSGSFVYSDPAVNHGEGQSFVPVIAFVDSYRADPVRVADRCFISCGAYEDLIDANRGMLPVFQQTGMAINYLESLAGHSWDAWRDQLRDALSWIFPADRP
jgi:enterochelin esterase-like enzyme